MSNPLDKEAKVGAMLRHMSGDVASAFERTLRDLYKSDNEELSESCAKWHWRVVKYASDPTMMREYVSVIQLAFEHGINLDEIPAWNRLMRIILPEEFIRKMAGFTQVPQIAVMDETKVVKLTETKDAGDVEW